MNRLMTSLGGEAAHSALRDGLVWASAWFVVGESAYACLGKLAIANAMGAAELCASVFARPLAPNDYSRRHPRDLLWGEWMTQRKSEGALIQQIRDGVLQREPGRWASGLASDDALRFCPTCLSLGFHHAACQIEALEKCPIHGDTLRSTCPQCGARTPRYALTHATFDAPFRCPSCGNWYGAAWGPTSTGNALSDIIVAETEYASLTRWLTELSALNLTWPNQSNWSCSFSDVERERRISVFHALNHLRASRTPVSLLAPSRQIAVVGSLRSSGPLTFSQVHVREQQMVSLYRAFRRWLWNSLGLGGDASNRSYVTQWLEEHEDGAMLVSPPDDPPELSAYILWRQRFEEARDIRAHKPLTSLRSRMASWPVDVIATMETWVAYCAMSFLADYAVCVHWQSQIETLDSPGPRNPRWMELVNEFRPKLNSSNPPWPCHLSYAYQSATPSTATAQVWIFVCAGEDYDAWIHHASQILVAIPSVAARLSRRYENASCETTLRQASESDRNSVAAAKLDRPQHLTDLNPGPELDGRDGAFRAPEGPSIPLQTDLQAINKWLDTFRDQPAAATSYRRALEKIVNWAYVQRGKAMSSLDSSDFDAFEAFLLNPTPRSLWIIGNGSGKEWAPFRGPLAPASIRSTMIAIRLLYDWLGNISYATNRHEIRQYRIGRLADTNPMNASSIMRIRCEPISGSAMTYLWRAIENDGTAEGLRRQLLISLCYYGTLSLPEAQALLGADLSIQPHETVIKVQRRKPGCQIVYVVPPLGELLNHWIELTGIQTASDDLWTIGNTTSERASEPLLGMGLAGIQQIARHAFRDAASLATMASDAHTAELLLNGGARRLANTFLQQVEDAGGDNWRLFGKPYSIPPSTLAYLGPRNKLSRQTLLEDLSRIAHLWRKP
ncbi:hypothetical protein OYT13_11365 [Pandoraea sp. XJJ-1]|uniref:hypothetical protein n=1 Tax=Pandoraea sp. XJJ-1 TaxID=3002643 RepID=UPI0022830879|nr:hypothetical protein [Pandoraea sp. XJJ-1]WAL84948.1 hypothetical protein OYT13_11365 [Pandoraea sp. XJJ-1]